jgi:Fe2+ transport system protein FeoA
LFDTGIQPHSSVRVVAVEPLGNLLQLQVTPAETGISHMLAMSAELAQVVEGTPLTRLHSELP